MMQKFEKRSKAKRKENLEKGDAMLDVPGGVESAAAIFERKRLENKMWSPTQPGFE